MTTNDSGKPMYAVVKVDVPSAQQPKGLYANLRGALYEAAGIVTGARGSTECVKARVVLIPPGETEDYDGIVVGEVRVGVLA